MSSARLPSVMVPPFVYQACQKLLVGSLPVIAGNLPVAECKEDVQCAILPVQPMMGSILIRLWVFLFGDVQVV